VLCFPPLYQQHFASNPPRNITLFFFTVDELLLSRFRYVLMSPPGDPWNRAYLHPFFVLYRVDRSLSHFDKDSILAFFFPRSLSL